MKTTRIKKLLLRQATLQEKLGKIGKEIDAAEDIAYRLSNKYDRVQDAEMEVDAEIYYALTAIRAEEGKVASERWIAMQRTKLFAEAKNDSRKRARNQKK